MKIGSVSIDERVLVVAEIGNNHEGRIDVAERLVREAAACGADAVKFQTYQTRHFVRPADQARYERMARFELSPASFRQLHRVAKDEGLLFISTPLDLPSVETLRDLVDAFKIASGDNTFYPLIDAVLATGGPVIISSGATPLDELRGIVAYVTSRRAGADVAAALAVLHCVSCYPAPHEQLNLAAIPALAQELGVPIGYSDHTLGPAACLAAVALGARIIEKHFTLDRNFSDYRDHQLSSDPAEFRDLVAALRQVSAAMGSAEKSVRPCEAEMRPAIRRSIVAAADLAAGHVLTRADLGWMRPAGGLAPGREDEVVGRRLSKALAQGEAIVQAGLE